MAGFGFGGGIGFQGLGPGFMPAGVPGQTAFAGVAGPGTPVIGSGNPLPAGAPTPATAATGGGFSFPTSWGQVGSLLGQGGRWLLDNPELLLAGLGAYQGYQASRDAGRNDERALALLEQRQAQLAPLAARGVEGLMSGGRPDLSHLTDRANPYAAQYAPVGQLAPAGGGTTARTRARRS